MDDRALKRNKPKRKLNDVWDVNDNMPKTQEALKLKFFFLIFQLNFNLFLNH